MTVSTSNSRIEAMKKTVKKNQKFNIIPQNVKGAASCTVLYTDKSFFDVEITTADMKYYKENGEVELFTVVDDGMMYFKSKIETVGDNIVTIKMPEAHEVIQRREHTRVPFTNQVKLKSGEKVYTCDCSDISAGGMKLFCYEDIEPKCDYEIKFSLDGKIEISAFFHPIRVKVEKKGKTILSGKFIALKNIDKIAIVQYCFKKETENVNK